MKCYLCLIIALLVSATTHAQTNQQPPVPPEPTPTSQQSPAALDFKEETPLEQVIYLLAKDAKPPIGIADLSVFRGETWSGIIPLKPTNQVIGEILTAKNFEWQIKDGMLYAKKKLGRVSLQGYTAEELAHGAPVRPDAGIYERTPYGPTYEELAKGAPVRPDIGAHFGFNGGYNGYYPTYGYGSAGFRIYDYCLMWLPEDQQNPDCHKMGQIKLHLEGSWKHGERKYRNGRVSVWFLDRDGNWMSNEGFVVSYNDWRDKTIRLPIGEYFVYFVRETDQIVVYNTQTTVRSNLETRWEPKKLGFAIELFHEGMKLSDIRRLRETISAEEWLKKP